MNPCIHCAHYRDLRDAMPWGERAFTLKTRDARTLRIAAETIRKTDGIIERSACRTLLDMADDLEGKS